VLGAKAGLLADWQCNTTAVAALLIAQQSAWCKKI